MPIDDNNNKKMNCNIRCGLPYVYDFPVASSSVILTALYNFIGGYLHLNVREIIRETINPFLLFTGNFVYIPREAIFFLLNVSN